MFYADDDDEDEWKYWQRNQKFAEFKREFVPEFRCSVIDDSMTEGLEKRG